jgi:hypothetical protein
MKDSTRELEKLLLHRWSQLSGDVESLLESSSSRLSEADLPDEPMFRSVWQIDLGTDRPHLITMYPE